MVIMTEWNPWKKFFYDFKTWNDTISCVLWKKKHYILWKKIQNSPKMNTSNNVYCNRIFPYSLNMNQSKSTDYQWNLTDSNS